jgi:heme-degrading monooxygenase HmoA
MFARVTMFEIDTMRISLDEALERFKQTIQPEVSKQPGYEGLYVLRTEEGKGCILSLWADEAAVIAGEESGYYDEQIAQFVSFYKSPPGREHYEVVLVDGVKSSS